MLVGVCWKRVLRVWLRCSRIGSRVLAWASGGFGCLFGSCRSCRFGCRGRSLRRVRSLRSRRRTISLVVGVP